MGKRDEYPAGLWCEDGFESLNQFFRWFSDDFYGQIIHWTDFRYNRNKYEGTDYHPDRIDHCIV